MVRSFLYFLLSFILISIFVLVLRDARTLSAHYIQVDILDTSGDMQFPAMRRLSIATAHAFLLVYATTSAPSFGCVKQCFEEIREQRADYQVNHCLFHVIFSSAIHMADIACSMYSIASVHGHWTGDRQTPHHNLHTNIKLKIENWILLAPIVHRVQWVVNARCRAIKRCAVNLWISIENNKNNNDCNLNSESSRSGVRARAKCVECQAHPRQRRWRDEIIPLHIVICIFADAQIILH